MVAKITNNIKISVTTTYEGQFLKNEIIHHAFQYQITIENKSPDTIQLMTRHWKIFDSLNNKQIVDGDGVVGKKPILRSKEKHIYTSGCILISTFGTMSGYFNFINHNTTNNFKAQIPKFNLSAPFLLN